MDYKWQLRKGSGKCECPSCGHKRFVPYVLAADNTTLAGREYGRCDREQNCGYHRYPNGVPAENKPIIKPAPQQPIEFYPARVMINTDTNLFAYAVRLVGYEAAKRAWSRYHVDKFGTGTLFWQISKGMQIRAGKVIQYQPNGHRVKGGLPVLWLHKSKFVIADGSWFRGQELKQCFYGEHLLAHKEYNDLPVAIVESEKTATLMSELRPEYLWLACGGSQNLKNADKNKVLAGRSVRLFPDNGQYNHWVCIAHANGWTCDDYLEHNTPFEGADILDLYEQHQETMKGGAQ